MTILFNIRDHPACECTYTNCIRNKYCTIYCDYMTLQIQIELYQTVEQVKCHGGSCFINVSFSLIVLRNCKFLYNFNCKLVYGISSGFRTRVKKGGHDLKSICTSRGGHLKFDKQGGRNPRRPPGFATRYAPPQPTLPRSTSLL